MAKRSGSAGRKRTVTPRESRIIQSYELTDSGNAERVIAAFGDRIRYVTSWGEYLCYANGVWRRDTAEVRIGDLIKQVVMAIPDEEGHDKGALRKWRKKSESYSARSAALKLLKNEKSIWVTHDLLDAGYWLLNCTNGTLDLRTGELKAHDPNDLITKQIPIAYNPKAKAPRWLKFLKEVLPNEEARTFMQRFHGYCLTGIVSERLLVILLGGGCNGKTAFLNAIESVMGPYSTTTAPTLLVAKEGESHPTEVADLHGARLAVSSETKQGATFDEEKVKRLTGTDRLKARRMREDFWHFDPTHKLLIASNHKPRVKDATDSFWDRVAIVPFEVRIARNKIDRKLGDKLMAEREGILAYLVDGCRQWREHGLARPKAIEEATQEYRTEEDIVGRFLTECIVVDRSAFELTADIVRVNKVWSDRLNLYPASAKSLAEKLRAAPYEATPHKRDGNMGWRGVKLTQKVKLK